MQFTYFQDKDDIKEKEYYSLLGKLSLEIENIPILKHLN